MTKDMKQLIICGLIIICLTILAINKIIDGILVSNTISIMLGYIFAGTKKEYSNFLDNNKKK